MSDVIDTQARILELAKDKGFLPEDISSDVQIKMLHMLQITYESMMDVGLYGADSCDEKALMEATEILNMRTWQFISEIFGCAGVLKRGAIIHDPDGS